ncbi:acetyl-CoA carboxylase carboxyltransferase subunit alpha [Cerasicoccus arenae]|uniref:Acetyl-coenzyme A carboxylase carboxyl transferase subunit alpha n=1 Tax=Cerasicoccus arenae TaxID=424488 RepID=A0A8J3GD57_9BACT|nr:acetyl-CoA carboxylase carboxyltransferase subunit alpha [Cerasicoccus arenae]MBK1856661.1 acetyl-CoA carboxylase carboxyltransferase subunit alpha [Cerasicoccus arenae]GHB98749.1 acetyl-coenzyme A carboxylase carboxyl transferase subunit alpha [Cerasicoccus arenae]
MEKPKYSLDFEKPIHELQAQLANLQRMSEESDLDVTDEVKAIKVKIEETRKRIHAGLTPWQKIQLARHPQRPYSLDYIDAIFEDFQELHGDRRYMDDQAIIGGPAFLNGDPVMIVAQQKGRSTKENLARNFGCPNPEGYRKALRLMEMAQKFGMPIICLIDTPGAYPGIGAEERHVAEAIAVNIREMSALTVPIIATIIGEGGSGGALGIAVADRILILDNAYYSVISPEGCAAILWKDRVHAPRAADALKITSDKLVELGVVDEIVPEPLGGAHIDAALAAENLKTALEVNLAALKKKSTKALLDGRYAKFRAMGQFAEA